MLNEVERLELIDTLPTTMDDSKEFIRMPISNFTKSYSPETILYNVARELNTNDTANINYVKGATNGHKLIPLSSLFCDNIVLYYIFTEEQINQSKILKRYIDEKTNKPKETNIKVNLELNVDSNGHVSPEIEVIDTLQATRDKVIKECSSFLAEHTYKILRIINSFGIFCTKDFIKPTTFDVVNGKLIQLIKISLPDANLSKVFDLIINHRELLEKENLYIHDIDLTQDYKGTINKNQVIQYLMESLDFEHQDEYLNANRYHLGSVLKNKNTYEESKSKYTDTQQFIKEEDTKEFFRNNLDDVLCNDDAKESSTSESSIKQSSTNENSTDFHINGGEYTIINNDKQVSKNCLTFITDTPLGRIRYKFYNKFIQSLESASVRGKIGNHITDWIDNKEKILKESIKNSLDTGLLRLEITFYIRDIRSISEKYFIEHCNFLKQLLPPHLIYYQPIHKQWELYLKQISYNLIVLDEENALALLSYATNKDTGKINGFYVDKTTSNKLSNIAKQFTLNLPIVYVIYRRDIKDLILQYFIYQKQIDNTKKLSTIYTYLTNGQSKFHVKSSSAIQPQDMGLLDNEIVKLRYYPHTNIATRNTRTVGISFLELPLDVVSLNFPTGNRKDRTRNAKAKLEMDCIANGLNPNDKETNEKINKILTAYENRTKRMESLSKLYRNEVPNKLTELETGDILNIYGIKFTNNKWGPTVILWGSITDKWEDTKLYYGTKEIFETISNVKNNWVEVNNIYFQLSEMPMFYVKYNGTKYINKNKKPVVEILNTKPNKITIETQEQFTAKESIEDLINIGDKITITATCPYRKSYYIKLLLNETKEMVCKSSRYLDEIIAKAITNNTNNLIKLQAGAKKLHPIARKKYFTFTEF